jgi:hypothetical protein
MDRTGTVLNDDEDRDLGSLRSYPAQDRRSGVDRRNGPSTNSLARLDIEREYRADIRQLRDEGTHQDAQIAELKAELSIIREWQRDKEETLAAAKVLVHTGVALKFTIMILIGFTAAIGGIAASMEAFKAWFR